MIKSGVIHLMCDYKTVHVADIPEVDLQRFVAREVRIVRHEGVDYAAQGMHRHGSTAHFGFVKIVDYVYELS